MINFIVCTLSKLIWRQPKVYHIYEDCRYDFAGEGFEHFLGSQTGYSFRDACEQLLKDDPHFHKKDLTYGDLCFKLKSGPVPPAPFQYETCNEGVMEDYLVNHFENEPKWNTTKLSNSAFRYRGRLVRF